MAQFYGQCLVIERDTYLLEKLHTEFARHEGPFLMMRSLKDAQSLMKRSESNVRALFVSLSFGMAEVTTFLETLRAQLYDQPVFLIIHQSYSKLPPDVLQRLDIREQLEGVTGEADLLKVLKRQFPEQHHWHNIPASSEQKGVELAVKEEELMPIPMDDFLLTEKCFFNVFLKIGKDKFLKVLNAGDPFDSNFAEKYAAKKVKDLWVKKSEHLQYTHLTEKNAASGVERMSEDVARRVAHLGDNVSRSLLRVGISDENLMYADRFLGHTVNYLRQMKIKNASFHKMFLELAKSDHATSVSVVAGLLSQRVGLESTKAIKVVGMAALLHDIAIYQERPDFPAEVPHKLSAADLEIYQRHAHKGAEMLSKVEGLAEVVIQAVAQHHDKHSNHGGRATNLVSEIISASDLFCHTVLLDPQGKVDDFLETHLKDYSNRIYDAFNAVLRRKGKRRPGGAA